MNDLFSVFFLDSFKQLIVYIDNPHILNTFLPFIPFFTHSLTQQLFIESYRVLGALF